MTEKHDLKIKMQITWKEGIENFLDKLKQCSTREEVYNTLMQHMQVTIISDIE